jgi:AmmeMemoRadiSam system protein B
MRIRPPAVAGSFYPGDPARLASTVDELVAAARPGPLPKGLVVPHAGYVYSGPVAGSAYRLAQGSAQVRRVVLLGPAHFAHVKGLALPDVDALETPLGAVPVDLGAVEVLRPLRQVVQDAGAHAQEHSLEVQLPFLQRTLGAFSVVPLVVGRAGPAEVAEVLEALWGGPETLVVISTDLSHYLPYADAARMDRETANRVLALGPPLEPPRACGAAPLNGLLHAAKARKLTAELLDLRSSGDTAGPRDGVVGYGAFTFREAAA